MKIGCLGITIPSGFFIFVHMETFRLTTIVVVEIVTCPAGPVHHRVVLKLSMLSRLFRSRVLSQILCQPCQYVRFAIFNRPAYLNVRDPTT